MTLLVVLTAITLGTEPSHLPQSVPARTVATISTHSADKTRPHQTGLAYCESENFVVHSHLPSVRADEVSRHCEHLSQRLHKDLHGQGTPSWRPKCEVVVHRSRHSYLKSVGKNGAQTIGSATLRLNAGKVQRRRVDLLALEPEQAVTALPHELIHIFFAEIFPDKAPPRWAEEGLALLNDADKKQKDHLVDLQRAVRTKTVLPLERLLVTANYPTGWQMAVFYGQSLSLVDYFTQQGTPEDFVRYVRLSMDFGHDHALRTVYKIEGLDDLERRWQEHSSASLALNDPS